MGHLLGGSVGCRTGLPSGFLAAFHHGLVDFLVVLWCTGSYVLFTVDKRVRIALCAAPKL